jgi:hypothetical protein
LREPVDGCGKNDSSLNIFGVVSYDANVLLLDLPEVVGGMILTLNGMDDGSSLDTDECCESGP